MFLKKMIRYVKDREYRFNVNREMGFYNKLSDREFLQKFLKAKYGKDTDIENPKTFNEKMQWLKLYDRNPLYTKVVDKYLVREHVASVIGSEHLIPLLGVWKDVDDIDFDVLPDKFVLKCNHNSGLGAYICDEKKNMNIKIVKRNLKKGMRENYYMAVGREWPYKDVQRRIIAEKYMVDESNNELKDYKFFTFSGRVYCIEVIYNRRTNPHCSFYTREWEYMPLSTLYPTDTVHQIKRPKYLEKMLEMAEKLANSVGNPAFLRVDLYYVNNWIYFGEFTFYHNSGGGKFQPKDYDRRLGDLIKL